jgi:hypothetical protein
MASKPPVYARFGLCHRGTEDCTHGAFLPPGEIGWEVVVALDGIA